MKLIIVLCVFWSWVYAQIDTSINHYDFRIPLANESSNGFTIEYHNYYKVIKDLVSQTTYCVLIPGVRDTPAECTGVVVSSAKKVAVMDDLHEVIPFIELLGIQDDITTIEHSENVASPCSNNLTSPETSDIIFSKRASVPGIHYITFSASSDQLTPLQKATWLIYLGAFFDKELPASAIYNQIASRYECHKITIGTTTIHKKIAWTSYDPTHHMYRVYHEPYYRQLSEDAALSLVRPNMNTVANYSSSTDADLLNMVNQIHSAEYIIDLSPPSVNYTAWLSQGRKAFKPESDIDKQIYKSMVAIDKGHVYSIQGLISHGQSDWFQRSHARPDLALLDVIFLVYPTYEVTAVFPMWIKVFGEDSRTMSADRYGDCAAITVSAFQQSQCSVSSQISTVNKKVPALSEGGKAGVSVGVILGVALVGVLALWLYRRHKRNKKHEFYRMNDI